MGFKIAPPQCLRVPLKVPSKVLMGPGPTNCPIEVLQAMTLPMLGHLHPEFTMVMDEVKEGLRYAFQTDSRNVCCFSSTGHGGIEGTIANLLEPGEVILIATNGVWGERAADMARRQGVVVRTLEKPPGESFLLDELEGGVLLHKPKVLFLVHVESSTGVVQRIEAVGDICRRHEVLLVVDAVASLGAVPFLMDAWLVDYVYSGSQKVLAAPPSLCPVALNDRALVAIKSRRTPVRSFYFELPGLLNYWGCDDEPRRYHHTGPVSSVYALREALSLFAREGLHELWERHRMCSIALQKGLQDLGLQLFVRKEVDRAPTVTTVEVPSGIDWKDVCNYLMTKGKVEIGGGLGPTAGRAWRIGLMGPNANLHNVRTVLQLLKDALTAKEGFRSKL